MFTYIHTHRCICTKIWKNSWLSLVQTCWWIIPYCQLGPGLDLGDTLHTLRCGPTAGLQCIGTGRVWSCEAIPNWWFGILGVPLCNNPLKTGVSQESKPPISHLQKKLYSNKNSHFFLVSFWLQVLTCNQILNSLRKGGVFPMNRVLFPGSVSTRRVGRSIGCLQTFGSCGARCIAGRLDKNLGYPWMNIDEYRWYTWNDGMKVGGQVWPNEIKSDDILPDLSHYISIASRNLDSRQMLGGFSGLLHRGHPYFIKQHPKPWKAHCHTQHHYGTLNHS